MPVVLRLALKKSRKNWCVGGGSKFRLSLPVRREAGRTRC
jgi:hypothetical protein